MPSFFGLEESVLEINSLVRVDGRDFRGPQGKSFSVGLVWLPGWCQHAPEETLPTVVSSESCGHSSSCSGTIVSGTILFVWVSLLSVREVGRRVSARPVVPR